MGIRHLTLYAFSKENWKRPKIDVDFLMLLFSRKLDEKIKELQEKKVVMNILGDKNDLGIHSEMISDGVWDLVEKGVMTCRKKNFLKGKIVITFAIGTTEFYQ